jgi:uncharacterized glyoxalase superfamily protein PhnB
MTDVTELKALAEEAEQQARTIMAVALALEDGELTTDEAVEAVELHHSDDSVALVQSDVYPGDEYFDRAVAELDGYA